MDVKKLGKGFWTALTVFSLVGQVAWVVENMYFNVFIYKIFRASAADISLMVGASAVAAAVTTVLMGALSDRVGKRKLLICGGYILWGVSILAFALIRVELLTPLVGSTAAAMALGVQLVIALDCLMTVIGSTANDAAFNAWMTDWGDESNRGRMEGINSMMPLVAILVVFGGFMAFDLDRAESWTVIFFIVGGTVIAIGVLGLFLVRDIPSLSPRQEGYWSTVLYSFRPGVVRDNLLLYAVLGAFALFNISIQIFMPYLILYYEKSLGMENYVLIMAPAIILASVITAFYGKTFDLVGFRTSVLPAVAALMGGYVLLYFGRSTVPVFLGSLLMMTGYLTGMAIFGAMIKSRIPKGKSGQFQGVRIIGQVLIPGVVGPAIGAAVLRNADTVVNSDGTVSFLPSENIFLAAFLAGVVLLAALFLIFHMVRTGHHRLLTPAGEELEEDGAVWSDYPRPQLRRGEWRSLNGWWTLNGSPIRVPFPPQSPLSGSRRRVGRRMVYRRTFDLPEPPAGTDRLLLHFGAVDQIAEVSLNGVSLGRHKGGYLPFTFDVTTAARPGENILSLTVTDALSHDLPYGKQRKDRGGMWYTPVSGIWQTVWLERVPERYISSLRFTPDLTGVEVEATLEGAGDVTAAVALPNGETLTALLPGGRGRIDLPSPRLWSPEDPYLYSVEFTFGADRVESYFALRTAEIRAVDGVNRLCLNGRPIFLHAVLDQGYFPDGIYLPAEPGEYERDVLRMRELGINTLRKHIKVEPECFYAYCDRHGMLVLQDMVNNGSYSFLRDTALPTLGRRERRDTRGGSKRARAAFAAHMTATQRHLYNHPCIIAYTIFNEGWGQSRADEMYDLARQTDPTRLYDATSGWFAQHRSDFDSEHIYFGDRKPAPKIRPLLLSEFGGFELEVPGHIYAKHASYGYGGCEDPAGLSARIVARYEELVLPFIPLGCCGAVYTQLSDVEDELNGLYTYDRRVCKVDKAAMAALSRRISDALPH